MTSNQITGNSIAGYEFKTPELLERALTHSSYANERKSAGNSNERLEFLGDSVLSIIVSEYLFLNYEHLPEGELTKLRASLVCEKALCKFTKSMGINERILLGRGEEQTGGRERPSILADAFEAVLAAIYLDGGIVPATKYVLKNIKTEISSEKHLGENDYKTILQEIIQKNPEERVEYRLAGEHGPDHDKTFTVEVWLNSNIIGRGEGRSKKSAEQAAAKEALLLMGALS